MKYEELFVVYRRVAQLQVVEPDVGEFVTSFNMAGASLILMWLDDELERFWRALANAPAYRKGSMIVAEPLAIDAIQPQMEEILPAASADSQQSAQQILHLLEAVAAMLQRNTEQLGRY